MERLPVKCCPCVAHVTNVCPARMLSKASVNMGKAAFYVLRCQRCVSPAAAYGIYMGRVVGWFCFGRAMKSHRRVSFTPIFHLRPGIVQPEEKLETGDGVGGASLAQAGSGVHGRPWDPYALQHQD